MSQLKGTDLSLFAQAPTIAAHDGSALDAVVRTRPNRNQRLAPEIGAGGDADAELRRLSSLRETTDLETVTGRENLAQALILRLLTPRGALADLGHSAYGSRLHELIGRRKTESLRNLCRAFVLEAAAQEPRVEPKAVSLEFDVASERADNFVFTLSVRSIESDEELTLSLEAAL